jgi:PAS domain S-box-containing protein
MTGAGRKMPADTLPGEEPSLTTESPAQRTEELLAAIFESSKDWISLLDADTRVLAMSRVGREALSLSHPGDVLGKGWSELFASADRDQAAAALEAAQRGDHAMFKSAAGPPEAPPRWWEMTVSPLHSREVLVIARDVTERRQREERARELAATLEQRVHDRTQALEEINRELEAFSYSVSHDLRAPIRHIGGFADLLERHAAAALDARATHYVKTIAAAARTAGQLVDDLLAFSRIGRAPVTLSSLDMNAIVEACRREVVAEAGGRVAEWRIARLPAITGDAPMVRLVFKNLLSNALKYSRKQALPVIEVGALASATEVTFHVRDNGVGFDMTYADKLFGVFQRLHRVDEFEGTGIGLANVKRIVQRHGGSVRGDGRPGAGATFHVTFPVSPMKER